MWALLGRLDESGQDYDTGLIRGVVPAEVAARVTCRAAGFPVAPPVDPAEVDAEADAINATWEAERRTDRLEAGVVDSELAP